MGKDPEVFPARLHPILARNGKDAVVFRRGPSKAVCAIHWDRTKDKFTVGQWLKGRIYERRADLSPDGKYLIYFAMDGKWDSDARGAWTAISRAPFLKAIELFAKGDCWHGGGLFTGSRRYWLNDGHGHEQTGKTNEVTRDVEFQPSEYFGGECTGVYYPRLLRDGWRLVETKNFGAMNSMTIFEKALPRQWVLRKLAHEQVDRPKGKGCYWDEHQLENSASGAVLDMSDWEWADLDGQRLVFTSSGQLYRVSLKSTTQISVPKMLQDFNGLTFEEKTAPY